MKKTFNYFLFILPAIFLLFSSCGKEVNSNTTDVVFSTGAITTTNLDDAVIIAVSVNDGRKMTFHAGASPAVMSVPNGLWRFYGYGWQNATGVMRCAYGGSTAPTTGPAADDIYLNGGGTSVYMEFTTSNCAFPSGNNVFHNGSAITGSTFLPLKVFLCGGNVDASVCPANAGPAVYSHVRLAGFTNYFGGVQIKEELTLISTCVASGVSTGYSLPPGNDTDVFDDFPFALLLETFTTSDCSGAPYKQILLDKGLAKSASLLPQYFRLVNQSLNFLELYINVVSGP